MENLPEEIWRIIFDYLGDNDIREINSSSKNLHDSIQLSEEKGEFFETKIYNCECGRKTIGSVSDEKEGEKYFFCSERCRKIFFKLFPRCYFCLNLVTEEKEKEGGKLFCSDECRSLSFSGTKRETYIS